MNVSTVDARTMATASFITDSPKISANKSTSTFISENIANTVTGSKVAEEWGLGLRVRVGLGVEVGVGWVMKLSINE